MICKTCDKEKECRPYGNKGEMICFDCTMSTPESKRTAEKMFKQQLAAAGDKFLIGLEAGPVRATAKMLNAVLKENSNG